MFRLQKKNSFLFEVGEKLENFIQPINLGFGLTNNSKVVLFKTKTRLGISFPPDFWNTLPGLSVRILRPYVVAVPLI